MSPQVAIQEPAVLTGNVGIAHVRAGSGDLGEEGVDGPEEGLRWLYKARPATWRCSLTFPVWKTRL
jgi:hypothetical protein